MGHDGSSYGGDKVFCGVMRAKQVCELSSAKGQSTAVGEETRSPVLPIGGCWTLCRESPQVSSMKVSVPGHTAAETLKCQRCLNHDKALKELFILKW